MSEKIEAKADKYLCDGRVTVLAVDPDRARSAVVEVQGTAKYLVRFVGAWTCDCPSRVDRCAHVVAAEKVVRVDSGNGLQFGEPDPEIDFLLDGM